MLFHRFFYVLAALLAVSVVFLGGFLSEPQPDTSHQQSTAQVQASTACDSLSGTAKILCLVDEFKATLSSSQISTLQLSYSLTNAKVWSNLPAAMSARNGLKLGSLTATQLAAAQALIQATTGSGSLEGYHEVLGLWAADDYLSANGGGSTYGAGNYYIAILGTPAMTGTWEVLFTGHHMTYSNTYTAGKQVGATPSFRASEPFGAFTQNGTTYQPVVQERDSLAAMLAGLSSTELASAKLSSTFGDILLGPGKDWQFPTTPSGLKAGNLTAAQKNLILSAIATYVNDCEDSTAAAFMALYASEIDDTYIAWSGNSSLSVKNDYVRIDGPHVWIEYSTQNGIILTPTHPHSVWRDRETDYGKTGTTYTGVNSVISAATASLYPNPTTDYATLTLALKQDAQLEVTVFTLSGQQTSLHSSQPAAAGTTAIELNTSTLPTGTYLCRIAATTASGTQMITQSLVKR